MPIDSMATRWALQFPQLLQQPSQSFRILEAAVDPQGHAFTNKMGPIKRIESLASGQQQTLHNRTLREMKYLEEAQKRNLTTQLFSKQS
ncbi:MAG: hypothetical protein Q9213_006680 [Squamulea squamosa]